MGNNMKYAVILGDGMADHPVKELMGKTPLECAKTPFFDFLATRSQIGMVKTVPDLMPPGSDVANLSVIGYDPAIYHTGRSPLEAASMGIEIKDGQCSYRCNIVTLSDNCEEYDNKIMLDYSSGEITTQEAAALIAAIKEHFAGEAGISFFPGISYRHIMLSDHDTDDSSLVPPHDISGRNIKDYLPQNEYIHKLMRESFDILSKHPVNKRRIDRGLNPANSIWIWGQGKKTTLSPFKEKFGISGGVITAVDLVRGIAVCADMQIFPVEGATGTVHSNFAGKAKAAVSALLGGCDLIYVHIEAADESGHHGSLEDKLDSIEKIDFVSKYIYDKLKDENLDFKIMVLPDHPTPLDIMTHTSEPVPFMIFDSRVKISNPGAKYNETYAKTTNVFIEKGHELMGYFIGK